MFFHYTLLFYFAQRELSFMGDRLPKFDSHVIDYFLFLADKMENQLDDETYASVKRIFDKDVFMFEDWMTPETR